MRTPIDYQQTADGVHVVGVGGSRTGYLDVHFISETLSAICRESDRGYLYVMINLSSHVALPLQELTACLQHFYRAFPEHRPVVAVVVQRPLEQVLYTMLRTRVSRESLRTFNRIESAVFWLNQKRRNGFV